MTLIALSSEHEVASMALTEATALGVTVDGDASTLLRKRFEAAFAEGGAGVDFVEHLAYFIFAFSPAADDGAPCPDEPSTDTPWCLPQGNPDDFFLEGVSWTTNLEHLGDTVLLDIEDKLRFLRVTSGLISGFLAFSFLVVFVVVVYMLATCKRADEAGQQAEFFRSKTFVAAAQSRLFSFVLHELKNPLHVLTHVADSLASMQFCDQDASDDIASMQWAVECLKRLAQDVLDHERLRAGRMKIEPVLTDLDRVARDVLFHSMKANFAKVPLFIDLDPDLAHPVVVDGPRVGQMLLNGLSNAFKITKTGRLLVRIRVLPGKSRDFSRFYVRDYLAAAAAQRVLPGDDPTSPFFVDQLARHPGSATGAVHSELAGGAHEGSRSTTSSTATAAAGSSGGRNLTVAERHARLLAAAEQERAPVAHRPASAHSSGTSTAVPAGSSQTPGSASEQGGDDIVVAPESFDGCILIEVEDTGPGIRGDPESLFEEFASSGGAASHGLGLPICRRLAESMAGDIWLENLEQEAFVFRVSQLVGPDSSTALAPAVVVEQVSDTAAPFPAPPSSSTVETGSASAAALTRVAGTGASPGTSAPSVTESHLHGSPRMTVTKTAADRPKGHRVHEIVLPKWGEGGAGESEGSSDATQRSGSSHTRSARRGSQDFLSPPGSALSPAGRHRRDKERSPEVGPDTTSHVESTRGRSLRAREDSSSMVSSHHSESSDASRASSSSHPPTPTHAADLGKTASSAGEAHPGTGMVGWPKSALSSAASAAVAATAAAVGASPNAAASSTTSRAHHRSDAHGGARHGTHGAHGHSTRRSESAAQPPAPGSQPAATSSSSFTPVMVLGRRDGSDPADRAGPPLAAPSPGTAQRALMGRARPTRGVTNVLWPAGMAPQSETVPRWGDGTQRSEVVVSSFAPGMNLSTIAEDDQSASALPGTVRDVVPASRPVDAIENSHSGHLRVEDRHARGSTFHARPESSAIAPSPITPLELSPSVKERRIVDAMLESLPGSALSMVAVFGSSKPARVARIGAGRDGSGSTSYAAQPAHLSSPEAGAGVGASGSRHPHLSSSGGQGSRRNQFSTSDLDRTDLPGAGALVSQSLRSGDLPDGTSSRPGPRSGMGPSDGSSLTPPRTHENSMRSIPPVQVGEGDVALIVLPSSTGVPGLAAENYAHNDAHLAVPPTPDFATVPGAARREAPRAGGASNNSNASARSSGLPAPAEPDATAPLAWPPAGVTAAPAAVDAAAPTPFHTGARFCVVIPFRWPPRASPLMDGSLAPATDPSGPFASMGASTVGGPGSNTVNFSGGDGSLRSVGPDFGPDARGHSVMHDTPAFSGTGLTQSDKSHHGGSLIDRGLSPAAPHAHSLDLSRMSVVRDTLPPAPAHPNSARLRSYPSHETASASPKAAEDGGALAQRLAERDAESHGARTSDPSSVGARDGVALMMAPTSTPTEHRGAAVTPAPAEPASLTGRSDNAQSTPSTVDASTPFSGVSRAVGAESSLLLDVPTSFAVGEEDRATLTSTVGASGAGAPSAVLSTSSPSRIRVARASGSGSERVSVPTRHRTTGSSRLGREAVAQSLGVPTHGPIHVLVVDDDASNARIAQRVFRMALERMGFAPTVVSAESGAEALLRVREAQASHAPFQLVATDYHMPGMNGAELALAIRSLGASSSSSSTAPSILLVTGEADAASELVGSWDAVLQKPFTTDTLVPVLGHLLGDS